VGLPCPGVSYPSYRRTHGALYGLHAPPFTGVYEVPSFSVLDILSIVLAAFFLIGSAINGIASKKVRDDYVRWGLPRWLPYITALLELTVAIVLVWPGMLRFSGALLGASVMLAAVLTLLRAKEVTHSIPAVLVGLCCIYVALQEAQY